MKDKPVEQLIEMRQIEGALPKHERGIACFWIFLFSFALVLFSAMLANTLYEFWTALNGQDSFERVMKQIFFITPTTDMVSYTLRKGYPVMSFMMVIFSFNTVRLLTARLFSKND